MPRQVRMGPVSSGSGQGLATTFMVVGFVAAVVGIGLYSVPLALIVGGAVTFVAGGLATRRMR